MGDDVGIPVQGWFVVKSVCVAADLNLGTDTRWIGQCHYNNYDVNNFEISHINTDFHFIYFNPKVLWLGKCTEGTN